MSPRRAWEVLMFEFNVHPDTVSIYTVELVAQAWECRARQLIEKGVWPKIYEGPTPEQQSDWFAVEHDPISGD